MPEFGIDSIIRDAGKIAVTGRCFKGPIRVGDAFITASTYLQERSAPPLDIDLVVKATEAYGRLMPSLDEGVTGMLIVEGEAPEVLGNGWLVKTESHE